MTIFKVEWIFKEIFLILQNLLLIPFATRIYRNKIPFLPLYKKSPQLTVMPRFSFLYKGKNHHFLLQ